MRHRKRGRKLGRKTGPRRALIRSVVRNLFLTQPDQEAGHLERIITTPAKAKEARPLAERIITLGKRGLRDIHDGGTGLAARRRATQLLGDRRAVTKLFREIAPRYMERPGGYTRILHWHTRRLGDNAPQVLFELVEAEMKPRDDRKRGPAPKPRPQQPPEPAAEQAQQTDAGDEAPQQPAATTDSEDT